MTDRQQSGVDYLLVSGSPRDGNTDYLLHRISNSLDGKKETIFLRKQTIAYCTGCLSCHTTKHCSIGDDMTIISEKIITAKALVLATPNYFENVSGLFKTFVDRLQPQYKTYALRNKETAILMVTGKRTDESIIHLRSSVEGFVEHLGLDLRFMAVFEGLHSNDLKQSLSFQSELEEAITAIKQMG